MLKVLLVDDEYIVLKGLKTMLAGQTNIEVEVYTASDAFEALEKLPEIRPDVIVADLNMPEMDGLAMIERIIDQGFACRFLILTGYEKVEYLKKAIRYRVVDYLLKPVNKQLLIQNLQIIQKEKKSKEEQTLFRLKMHILYNEPQPDQLSKQKLQELLPHPYLCICVRLAGEREDYEFRRLISNYCDSWLDLYQANMHICILNFSQLLERRVIAEIWDIIYQGDRHPIGIGPIESMDRFAQRIQLSTASVPFVYAVKDLICCYLARPNQANEFFSEPFDEDDAALLNVMGIMQNKLEATVYLDRLMQEDELPQKIFADVYTSVVACDLVMTGSSIQLESIASSYFGLTLRVIDTYELSAIVLDMLTHSWDYDRDISEQKEPAVYTEKVGLAVAYINQHYSEDLSLDVVAEQVRLHPSYLSHCFKKEVGISFLGYLHKIRIEAACKLLARNPRLSVESISQQVGYHTPTYFHKIFRSRIQDSPSQWRVKNMN